MMDGNRLPKWKLSNLIFDAYILVYFNLNKMKKDGLKFRKGSENIGTHSGEDEIRLKQDELENPIKYIKEIIIFKDKEKDYLKLTNLLDSNSLNYKLI